MPSPTGKHWTRLRHNGVAFPEPYHAKGLAINIRQRRIVLSPLAEEMAYAWAKKKDTVYVRDPSFQRNFLKDFLSQLPTEHHSVSSISEIDFSEIYHLVDREKKAKEALMKEERKRIASERKRRREELKGKYGWAEIDGHQVEVQNWMVEPPGLFLGRGNHPIRGRWKPRVHPEDIVLNLDKGVAPPPGRWKAIFHRLDCMWLASWVDKLTGKEKYVWLHESSLLRQGRDRIKYDLAAKLETRVERVRRAITRALRARDEKLRKLATVSYLVDKLCMRVGDEKDPGEADTVGATTLRVEHVRVTKQAVEFDFVGKDSVYWQKNISLVEADQNFVENLRLFIQGKKGSDNIFDGVSSSMVNRFLSKAMPGITAKVFRTYHATKKAREYLTHVNGKLAEQDAWTKLYHAKMANLEAAITCNHKRTPPKNWRESLLKKEERLGQLLSKKPKTPKQAQRRSERVNKLRRDIDLAKATRDYNLATSLKNYIDPRVYVSWSHHIGLDWRIIYTKSLQRKFLWAARSRIKWLYQRAAKVAPMIRTRS